MMCHPLTPLLVFAHGASLCRASHTLPGAISIDAAGQLQSEADGAGDADAEPAHEPLQSALVGEDAEVVLATSGQEAQRSAAHVDPIRYHPRSVFRLRRRPSVRHAEPAFFGRGASVRQATDGSSDSAIAAGSSSCGWVDPGRMPTCSEEALGKYRELSSVLRDDPGNVSMLFGKAIFLGEHDALVTCQAAAFKLGADRVVMLDVNGQPMLNGEGQARDEDLRQAAPLRKASSLDSREMMQANFSRLAVVASMVGATLVGEGVKASRKGPPRLPLRFILDTRYDTQPRCCNPMEMRRFSNLESLSLWRSSGASRVRRRIRFWCPEGATMLDQLPRARDRCKQAVQVQFDEVWPKALSCSARVPCPLVVQLTQGDGHIGLPWLLFQSHCAACYDQLRAVLVAPDFGGGTGAKGAAGRPSNEELNSTVVPIVESLLAETPSLDRERVFLVAQGGGCDVAIRAALLRPDIFYMAVLSGMFTVTVEAKHLVREQQSNLLSPSLRLRSMQFHFGDLDTTHDKQFFFDSFRDLVRPLRWKIAVDVRIYPGVGHHTFFSAWNALHDVIWTGVTDPITNRERALTHVPLTCGGPEGYGFLKARLLLATLVAIAVLMGSVRPASRPRPGHGVEPEEWADTRGFGIEMASEQGAAESGELLAERLNRELLGTTTSILDLLQSRQHQPAFITVGGRHPLSHAELHGIAAGTDLSVFGVAPRSRVAVLLPDEDIVAGILVRLMVRYVAVPLNHDQCWEEILALATAFEVKAIITSDSLARRAEPFLEGVCVLTVASSEAAGQGRLISVDGQVAEEAAMNLDEDDDGPLLQMPKAAEQEQSSPPAEPNGLDDVVLLLQTSGTTARPKVVPLTLRQLALGSLTFATAVGLSSEDRTLSAMPLHHIGGLETNLLATLFTGGAVVFAPGCKEQQDIPAFFRRSRITYYSATPTTHMAILTALEEAAASSSHRCAPGGAAAAPRLVLQRLATGAAALPQQLALRLQRVFKGASIVSTYGMTECMPVSAGTYGKGIWTTDSVGKPIGARIEVRCQDGIRLAHSEAGEVHVHSPLLVSGEEAKPAEAEPSSGGIEVGSCDEDGWLRTGDLGVLDERGCLYLLGRQKEVVNRGGELVSPFEVESVIAKFPGIKHCMAFAAPHRCWGEAVALAVVMGHSRTMGLEDLQDFCSGRLSAAKIPEALVFVMELPRTETGKLQRCGMAARLQMPELHKDMGSGDRVFIQSGGHALRLAVSDPSPEGAPGAATAEALTLETRVKQVVCETSVAEAAISKKPACVGLDGHVEPLRQAIFGVCALQLLYYQWLRGSSLFALAGAAEWLVVLAQLLRDCRSWAVIFPLMGFVDGRTARRGGNPSKQVPMILALHVVCAWPALLPDVGVPFQVPMVQRWPLWTLLLCASARSLCDGLGVMPPVQIATTFVAAPVFSRTPDALHAALGLPAFPERGVWDDPSLFLLQHRFQHSFGAKLYFMGCYLLAYHVLAQDQLAGPILRAAAAHGRVVSCTRLMSLVLLLVVTVAWSTVGQPYDPTDVDEAADWPAFLGKAYPVMMAADWLCMGLLFAAVGTGNRLLRLMGDCLPGVMVCHVVAQLRVPDLLQEASLVGGPGLALLALLFLPVVYILGVGQFCQFLLEVPGLALGWFRAHL